jgi:hypothetical protein
VFELHCYGVGREFSRLLVGAYSVGVKRGKQLLHAHAAGAHSVKKTHLEKSTSRSFVQLPISKGMLARRFEPATARSDASGRVVSDGRHEGPNTGETKAPQ